MKAIIPFLQSNLIVQTRKCKDIEDPTPAMCVMNLKPLVERKLNESRSRESATVDPNATVVVAELEEPELIEKEEESFSI